MYTSFTEFKAKREQADFNQKFDGLCEAIAVSGIGFDQFWQHHALPILPRAESCSSEEQLLSEFNWGMMNPMNWFGGGQGQQPAAPQQQQPQQPQMSPEQQ